MENQFTVSPNSAFKPYTVHKNEQNDLVYHAKRVYAVYKSKNILPYFHKEKVLFLMATDENESINGFINKLSKKELEIFIKSAFGKEAFVENPPWDLLWAVFRRKLMKNSFLKPISVQKLFYSYKNKIILNPNLW